MLPNFLIIGAEKAATSWLRDMLGCHPDVFVYKPGETHFFDEHFDKGRDWYEAHFEDWSGQPRVGEKTPQYLSHPLAAERIRSSLGEDVRFIASLRHPVDRAYSAYWHRMRRGRTSPRTDFASAFHKHERLRSEGTYGQHVKRFVDRFPRTSLHLLIFEEMMQDRRAALASCYDFLGVDTEFVPPEPERRVNRAKDVYFLNPQIPFAERLLERLPRLVRLRASHTARRVFPAMVGHRSYVRLSEDVRQEVLEYYADDIALLEETLGRDLSIWRMPRDQQVTSR